MHTLLKRMASSCLRAQGLICQPVARGLGIRLFQDCDSWASFSTSKGARTINKGLVILIHVSWIYQQISAGWSLWIWRCERESFDWLGFIKNDLISVPLVGHCFLNFDWSSSPVEILCCICAHYRSSRERVLLSFIWFWLLRLHSDVR